MSSILYRYLVYYYTYIYNILCHEDYIPTLRAFCFVGGRRSFHSDGVKRLVSSIRPNRVASYTYINGTDCV